VVSDADMLLRTITQAHQILSHPLLTDHEKQEMCRDLRNDLEPRIQKINLTAAFLGAVADDPKLWVETALELVTLAKGRLSPRIAINDLRREIEQAKDQIKNHRTSCQHFWQTIRESNDWDGQDYQAIVTHYRHQICFVCDDERMIENKSR